MSWRKNGLWGSDDCDNRQLLDKFCYRKEWRIREYLKSNIYAGICAFFVCLFNWLKYLFNPVFIHYFKIVFYKGILLIYHYQLLNIIYCIYLKFVMRTYIYKIMYLVILYLHLSSNFNCNVYLLVSRLPYINSTHFIVCLANL